MSNTNKGNPLVTIIKLLVVLACIMLALTPAIAGKLVADRMVEGQRLSCDMLESGLGQLNPQQPGQAGPQTAAQCKQAVELAMPIAYFICIVGAYVFAVVFLGFGLFGLIMINMVSRRRAARAS
jgi:hypothetical protein